jgi:hypothetical protein
MLFVTLSAALLAGYTYVGAHTDLDEPLALKVSCETISNVKRMQLVYYPPANPWQNRTLETGPIFEWTENERLANTPPLLETPEPLPNCLNFILWT